jgi:hypothetical protein
MSQLFGSIVNVATTNVGEWLTADVAAGADRLPVTNVSTFDEKGGYVSIEGTIYDYYGVDLDTGELLLRTGGGLMLVFYGGVVNPLVMGDEGIRVEIYPPQPEKVALVDFATEDGGEAVFAIVPHDLVAVVPDGYREEEFREAVLVEERGAGELYLKDVPTTPPNIEVEVTLGDGVVPIASPTPVLTGWVGALHAKWAAILNNELCQYDVHISTTSGFTVDDATTLVGTTTATSMTIRSLPTDAPLTYGVTYYVKIVARDSDGAAVPGGEASAQMQPITGPDISASYVYAGTVQAPQIEGGEITADLILSGSIATALTGGRTFIDNAGIVIYDSTGVPGTTLAPDNSVFVGDAEIGGLTVKDAMSIRGVNNELSTSAELMLAAGITAPSTGPSVVQDWDQIIFTKSGDASFNAANITSVQWLVDKWICGYRDGGTYRVYRFNSDGTYHSLAADSIVSSTALQTTQISAGGLCYTIASNHTIYRHRVAPGTYTFLVEDDFTSALGAIWTSVNTAVWDSGSGGQAKFVGDGHLMTDAIYDFKGSQVQCKVNRTAGTDGQDFFLTVRDTSGDECAQMKLEGSDLYFRIYGPSPGTLDTETSITYNSTSHKYWKISEVDAVGGGGDFHFYTSPDGVTWTERRSGDHDLSIGDLTDCAFRFTAQEDEPSSGTLTVFVDEFRYGLNNDGISSAAFDTQNNDGDVMTIGNNGTNLLLAEHDNSGGDDRIRVRVIDQNVVFTDFPSAVLSTFNSTSDSVYDGPLAGILLGSFDFGASRYVTKRANNQSEDWRVFNSSTGARVSAEEFPPSTATKGITWDGSFFWELGSGRIYKHTAATLSGSYLAGYTWYDSNATGGTHETTISPLSALTLKRRARITLTGVAIPGAGGTDDPNSVRFYVGVTSGTLKLQSTTGAGVYTATYQAITTGGAAPPGSNNFPGGTPAKIKSTSGGLIISGDGTISGGIFSGSFGNTEIGNAVNLDTITTPGMYVQSSDAEAAAGTNYPPLAPYAGVLEVFGVSAILMQRYSAYRNSDVNPSPNIWERTSVGGTWGAWQPINYDTGWITTISSVAVAATNMTLTAANIRRINKTVQFSLDWQWDAGIGVTNGTGNLVDTDIATLVSRWRPTGAPDQGGMINNNGTRNVVAQVKASGLVIAVTSAGDDDFAANLATSCGGTYLMP